MLDVYIGWGLSMIRRFKISRKMPGHELFSDDITCATLADYLTVVLNY